MHPVYLNRFVNLVAALPLRLHLWRMEEEMQSLMQKRYAQKPKNPV